MAVRNRAEPTVYALTQAHKIPFYQSGKMLQFKRSELMAWMEGARQQTSVQTHDEMVKQIPNKLREEQLLGSR